MFSGATSIISDIWGKKRPQEVKASRSFAITESRRAELLEEARSRRIAWVDGRKTTDEASVLARLNEGSFSLTTAEDILSFLDKLCQPEKQSPPATSFGTSDKIFSDLMHRHQEDNGEFCGDANEKRYTIGYSEFLDMLRQPATADLVLNIQNFVKSFDSQDIAAMMKNPLTKDQPAAMVHSFIDQMVQQTDKHRLLGRYPSLQELDVRREAFETFVMEKIYAKAFAPTKSDEEKDEGLSRRIASLAFVRFEHLDITATSAEMIPRWEAVQKKLQNLSKFKSPGSKMNCILSVCQDLTGILKDSHENGRFPSADEFLPALIYVVLKSNPAQLHSSIDFINQYRHPSKLLSEPGYFFTHIVSAVSFLENLDDSSLTISPAEFEAGLKQTREALSVSVASIAPPVPSVPTADDPVTFNNLNELECIPLPSIMDIRKTRLETEKMLNPVAVVPESKNSETMALINETNDRKKALSEFTFINHSEADLHVCDIPRLLREYKELHALCASLHEQISLINYSPSKDTTKQLLKGAFKSR